MVAQASRTVAPLAALALDLDHFKQINDSYGHPIGDAVLAAVGSTLTATVREGDFVGRAGGEEFLILLPNTSTDGAQRVAEKIRAAVAAIAIPKVEQPITASLGIAVLPDHAGDGTALLRHADRALYSAKKNGRNRTETFTHETPTPDRSSTAISTIAEPTDSSASRPPRKTTRRVSAETPTHARRVNLIERQRDQRESEASPTPAPTAVATLLFLNPDVEPPPVPPHMRRAGPCTPPARPWFRRWPEQSDRIVLDLGGAAV